MHQVANARRQLAAAMQRLAPVLAKRRVRGHTTRGLQPQDDFPFGDRHLPACRTCEQARKAKFDRYRRGRVDRFTYRIVNKMSNIWRKLDSRSLTLKDAVEQIGRYLKVRGELSRREAAQFHQTIANLPDR
jgi:hypothetical protein